MPFESTHKGLDLKLKLKFNADELRQGDLEAFMAAYASFKHLGTTLPEDNGKTLRAAIKAGWIEEPKMALDDVAAMRPVTVRWYAEQIDSVYTKARTIPPE
jgi:hypothetical protein